MVKSLNLKEAIALDKSIDQYVIRNGEYFRVARTASRSWLEDLFTDNAVVFAQAA